MISAPEEPTPNQSTSDFMPNLKHIYTVQAALVGVSSLLLFFVARDQLPAFVSGALMITMNFVFLVALWQGIMEKKPVARTLTLVVIKYAILGAVLYIFVKEFRLSLIPLMVGISTLGGTFVLVALQTHILNRSR